MARGGAGYVLIQRWNLLDSFSMTLITITTIGYSEMHPLTDAGRLFTSSLILGGVGVMLWTLGIFSEVLGTGQLAQYGRWKGTEAHKRRVRDHFIICGYGRMGTQIALEMRESNIPYVVVEHDPEVVRRLQRKGDLYVEGDAASEVVLIDQGARLGRTLAELGLLDPGGAHILAVRRAGGEMHVSPALALRLEAGDLIFALGSEKQLKELSSRLL